MKPVVEEEVKNLNTTPPLLFWRRGRGMRS
jgi:hypothetical protein